ncbi:MAG: glucose-1-phosphate cytidylyltransferase [Albidovulum sp.]|uniref:glucose-1-phosphate cytidylyltransferase n=1 Tax=Albidovulum sp. TaxID=1872424 RepID=UPI003CAFDF65
MKCVLLAGGFGTRLAEETTRIPKPMVEIGGRPILWHIMKIYAAHGINDFVICCGYKGYVIKEYFANYYLHGADVTFDLRKGTTEVINNQSEPWRVTLIDTGQESMTGGRLRRVMPYLKDEEAFCMTYGDGVGNIDVSRSIAFHKAHGKMATITAVPPAARFGRLDISDGQVNEFSEKPADDGGVINGGYFVLSPKVAKHLVDDATIWERAPLMALAKEGELMAYEHKGFWQPMDTIRERQELEAHWATGEAPWKIW